MIIFEGFALDFTNIILAFASSVIIYFAWKSTNVRENRLPRTTVFIIENNRRRLLENTVRPPVNIVRSPSEQSNHSETTEELELENDQTSPLQELNIPEPPSLQAIIDEVTDFAASSNYRRAEDNITDLLEDTDIGPRQIIEEMDSPDSPEGLRRRRLAFYAGERNAEQNTETSTSEEQSQIVTTNRRENLNLQSGDSTDNSHAENCSNENNENENISKTESKNSQNTSNNQDNPKEDTSEFRIKLKYLNDDLRLVKGTPNEAIGDFKKRNFTVELSAQKLVRLVFNGHVLQPDSKTLQACGLFDNCVVHCLIHKKPSLPEGQNEGRIIPNNDEPVIRRGTIDTNLFVDRNSMGPAFVYFGIALVTTTLIFCWYCRVQYNYLFTWYSTIGLVLTTVMFVVIFPLIILIERDVTS